MDTVAPAMPPTDAPHWILDPLALTLVLSYLVIFALSAFQLYSIATHQHRMKTFQTGFLFLCMFFSCLRVVFWIKTMFTSIWGFPETLFLFLFPNIVQFSIFSLLVTYYVSVVHKPDWKRIYRRRYQQAWALTNAVFVAIVLALCVCYSSALNLSSDESKALTEVVDRLYLGYLGFLDVLLSSMLVLYGTKFDR